jgi:catechol 2,3-dioxygenase-like lactoylglutathione lyase family enzyme
MRIAFVSSFSPIVRDPATSQAFYRDALGVAFDGQVDDYVFTEKLEGVKHFGLWPLTEAAQACYGTPDWPGDVPVPQASLEFDLESAEAVPAAADELVARGYRLIHGARTEPWGQSLARLLSPEGLLVGVSYTPWMHPHVDPVG